MASIIIQIERWQGTDMAFIRTRVYGAPETDETYKDVLRSIDHDVLRGTCVPVEYQPHAGALISLMFKFSERVVSVIEVRYLDYTNFWVAAAQIDPAGDPPGEPSDEGDGMVHRQGIGETLIDALVDLSYDIQQYE